MAGCKYICSRYRAKKNQGGSRYVNGQKRGRCACGVMIREAELKGKLKRKS